MKSDNENRKPILPARVIKDPRRLVRNAYIQGANAYDAMPEHMKRLFLTVTPTTLFYYYPEGIELLGHA